MFFANNGKGGIDTVKGRRGNAACIARTLSTRIEVVGGNRLECIEVARYADSTTTAALDAKDNGIVGEETAVLAIEVTEALLKACANHRR